MLTTAALLLQLLVAPAPQHARLLRDAHAAQGRFEGLRRMHLPRVPRGSGGRCDAIIGRFCYTYDASDMPVVPEPKQIITARTRLLSFLDSATAADPSEPWTLGQYTRYLIEAGRAPDAVAVLQRCRAEPWWCAALAGLALHVAERYEAADSAYDVALRAMPERQRCEWHDLTALVDDPLHRVLSRADCARRAALAADAWTLAKPLWRTRGNDLRTEHYARLTMALVLAGSANAHGMVWGDDSRELLLRYGWAEWFTRDDSDVNLYTGPRITGHDREPSYFFFAGVPPAGASARLSQNLRDLQRGLAPSRYAPRYLKGLSELPHQLARFPRGDSLLIAVAFAARDTALVHDSLDATLATRQHERVVVHGPAHAGLQGMIANDAFIASIEVAGVQSKHVARARYAVDALPLTSGGTLSDALLFNPDIYRGDSVDSLLAAALTEMRVSAARPLGVYWELRTAPGPVWMDLDVEPIHVGVARRLATRLRLAPTPSAVRLRWQASVRDSIKAENVIVQLPRGVRGRYRLVLKAETGRGETFQAVREVEVTRY